MADEPVERDIGSGDGGIAKETELECMESRGRQATKMTIPTGMFAGVSQHGGAIESERALR